jgi:hypothetical protein
VAKDSNDGRVRRIRREPLELGVVDPASYPRVSLRRSSRAPLEDLVSLSECLCDDSYEAKYRSGV